MVQFRKRKSDGQSFPVGNNKKIRASNPSNDVGGITIGGGTKIPKQERIKATLLEDLRDVRDHPLYENDAENWLSIFEQKPEVIIPDERQQRFWLWYGGESHTVHEITPDGVEVDVWTFGFDKNKLSKEEVVQMIEDRELNQRDEE